MSTFPKGARGARMGFEAELFSLEAEAAILGAALTDPPAVLGQIGVKLRPQSFFEVKHAWIWEAIQAIAAERGANAVSLISVHERLRAKGVEVAPYELSQMASEGCLYVPQASQHADIVLRLAVRRALVQQAAETIDLARSGEIETSEAVERALRGMMHIANGLARLETRSAKDVFKAVAQAVEDWRAEPRRLRGYSTGFPTLDRATGGLRRGQLISLLAATSMGKSMLARALIRNLLPQGRVLWATTEMPVSVSAAMLAAEEAGLTYSEIERGDYSEAHDAAFQRAVHKYQVELGERLIFLPDGETNLTALSAQALTLAHQRSGLAAVVIDSASKLSDGAARRDIFERVTAVSNALQRLALRANVVVIATWQIGRNALRERDYIPDLNAVKGSGAVEEDSDVVISLYRRDYYVKRGLLPPDPRYPEGTATLFVLKNRYGGSGSESVTLRFAPGRGIVEEEEVGHGESDLG